MSMNVAMLRTVRLCVILGFIRTAFAHHHGINPALCSDDMLYCYDEHAQSIVKVGSVHTPGTFGTESTQHINSAYGAIDGTANTIGSIGPQINGSQCQVVGVTTDTPGTYRPGTNQSAIFSSLRNATVDRATCITPITRIQPALEMSVPQPQYYPPPAQYYPPAPQPQYYPSAPMPRMPSYTPAPLYGSTLAESLSVPEKPPVTVTEDSICFNRPKKKYLNVKCCKTTTIPVQAQPPAVDPCICPFKDGALVNASSAMLQGLGSQAGFGTTVGSMMPGPQLSMQGINNTSYVSDTVIANDLNNLERLRMITSI
ncbi:hypothetical protein NEOKW01_1855 [Nematocida sp. AWRm80]|nr:hypothetical protein NEOKW01_1855 [Nematocida sp. AWRm80]